MAEVRRKACDECPFRRDSVPGWLGNAKGPEDFLMPHWNDLLPKLPCHLEINWEDRTVVEDMIEDAHHCRGYILLMKHSCKMPRDIEVAGLVSAIHPARDTFFTSSVQFMEHHDGH